MRNHHLCVKREDSVSNIASRANNISSLSIHCNDATNNVDDSVTNAFRSYNNNRNNNSTYKNNQRNNIDDCFNKSNNQRHFRGECCACNEVGHNSSNFSLLIN